VCAVSVESIQSTLSPNALQGSVGAAAEETQELRHCPSPEELAI
jgi:hypothetical protein